MPPRRLHVVGGAALLFVIQATLLALVAARRPIDGDEGFYLMAARQMRGGALPYVDFFFPQMPLSPALYGAWGTVVGDGFLAGRALSCVMAAATGTVIFFAVARKADLRWALLAVALYLGSPQTLAWQGVVKTFASSTFLAVAAWAVLERGRTTRGLLAAGLLAGLAIDARLLFVAAALPMFFWTARRPPCPAGWGDARWTFGAGALLALTPSIALACAAPASFYYGNLGWHSERSAAGPVGEWHQKLDVAREVLGLRTTANPADGGMAVLLLWTVGAAIGCARRGRAPERSLQIALALIVVSFLPTPTWPQYFCVAVPFLAVATSLAMRDAWSVSWMRWFVVPSLVVPLAMLPNAVRRIALTGEGVPLAASGEVGPWTLAGVERVARAIDRYAAPGEVVLTWWPGYLVGTSARPVPGLENHFSLFGAISKSAVDRRTLKLLGNDEVVGLIASNHVRVVVAGNFIRLDRVRPRLLAAGYVMREEFREQRAEIWTLPDSVNVQPAPLEPAP